MLQVREKDIAIEWYLDVNKRCKRRDCHLLCPLLCLSQTMWGADWVLWKQLLKPAKTP